MRSILLGCAHEQRFARWVAGLLAFGAIDLCACAAPPEPIAEGARNSVDQSPIEKTFGLLSEVALNAERIGTIHFSKPCFECRTASLTANEVLKDADVRMLDAAAAEEVRKLFADKGPFALNLAKPCPSIFATQALVFYGKGEASVLLIYGNCKTGRLVLSNPLQPVFFNLDLVLPKLDALSRPTD